MEKTFRKDLKILVVDDASGSRKMLLKKLSDLGLTKVQEAKDGAMAQELIKGSQDPFGLIVSDINMPNMTGLELLRWVRGEPRLKDTPFMIISAEIEGKTIMEAIKSGVTTYLVKPVDGEELKEKLLSIGDIIEGEAASGK